MREWERRVQVVVVRVGNGLGWPWPFEKPLKGGEMRKGEGERKGRKKKKEQEVEGGGGKRMWCSFHSLHRGYHSSSKQTTITFDDDKM